MKQKHAAFLPFLLSGLLGLYLGFPPCSRAADDDDKPEFIPTGVHITPSAASGSIFQPLNPGLSFDPGFTVGQAVSTALSPDGRTQISLRVPTRVIRIPRNPTNMCSSTT
jgi:hypothetical protein